MELPALDLRHLRLMTDDTGLLQHSMFGVPRYDDGYCLDDNARALLLMALIEDARVEERQAVRALASRYLAFVSHAYNADVAMAFTGHVSAADVRAAMAELLLHLEAGECEIVVDLSGLTGFSVAGATVAQRAVWPKRSAIRHVRFLGGPLGARIMASATRRLLGIGCTVERVGFEF
jgi:hypothetical protein